jgi:hypothetical protein
MHHPNSSPLLDVISSCGMDAGIGLGRDYRTTNPQKTETMIRRRKKKNKKRKNKKTRKRMRRRRKDDDDDDDGSGDDNDVDVYFVITSTLMEAGHDLFGI